MQQFWNSMSRYPSTCIYPAAVPWLHAARELNLPWHTCDLLIHTIGTDGEVELCTVGTPVIAVALQERPLACSPVWRASS